MRFCYSLGVVFLLLAPGVVFHVCQFCSVRGRRGAVSEIACLHFELGEMPWTGQAGQEHVGNCRVAINGQ